MVDATKRVSTGAVARLWRVDASRVRQVLRELAASDQLPDGFDRTPGGHARIPLSWAQAYKRNVVSCST